MARGPAYPYFDLKKAVEMADKVKRFTGGRRPAAADAVVQEGWGYSAKSSSGVKSLAALKYFGLLQDVQDNAHKQVKLTDRALTILLAHDGPERQQALQEAALMPKMYKYCWESWGQDCPPAMRTTLLLEKGFVENSVDAFIKDYKATINFAELAENKADEPVDLSDDQEGEIIGDQEGDEVDLSTSGAQQGNLERARAQKTRRVEAGMRQATWPLDEGEVTLQWPSEISQESLTRLEAWLDFLKMDIQQSAVKPRQQTTEDDGRE